VAAEPVSAYNQTERSGAGSQVAADLERFNPNRVRPPRRVISSDEKRSRPFTYSRSSFMKSQPRTAFQQQVVEALVQSKAINLEAVGATMAKFGERALVQGETLVSIINRNAIWNCGWPGPELDIVRGAQHQ
jgi:hypothetical protein